MTYDDVQVFLAIRRCGSISKAAQSLFLSQSAVSHRLKALEKELGTVLFFRNQGHRSIELTPQGKQFESIAEHWLGFYNKMQHIQTAPCRVDLTIGAVDSVNYYLFPPFYERFLKENPLISLNILTGHSADLRAMFDQKKLDACLVNSNLFYSDPDVRAELLFTEEYVALQPQNREGEESGGYVHAGDLSVEKELFYSFDLPHRQWHNSWWQEEKIRVKVNAFFMAERFLSISDYWCIAPISMALALVRDHPLVWRHFYETPPLRSCYLATRRLPPAHLSDAIDLFVEELRNYLRDQKIVDSRTV